MICTASSLVSEKSYGCASRFSPMPYFSKSGTQLLHRLVEGVLRPQRIVGVTGQLRVDHRAFQFGRDLQQATPVAHLSLTFLLIGRGPVENRDQRQQLHAGFLAGLLDVGDGRVIGFGVPMPEEEVRARGEFEVLVTQLGGLADLVGDGQVGVVHGRVEGDLDHSVIPSSRRWGAGNGGGSEMLRGRQTGRWGGAMSNPSPHDLPRVRGCCDQLYSAGLSTSLTAMRSPECRASTAASDTTAAA